MKRGGLWLQVNRGWGAGCFAPNGLESGLRPNRSAHRLATIFTKDGRTEVPLIRRGYIRVTWKWGRQVAWGSKRSKVVRRVYRVIRRIGIWISSVGVVWTRHVNVGIGVHPGGAFIL